MENADCFLKLLLQCIGILVGTVLRCRTPVSQLVQASFGTVFLWSVSQTDVVVSCGGINYASRSVSTEENNHMFLFRLLPTIIECAFKEVGVLWLDCEDRLLKYMK
ncbi:unnamed protein product [Citrullus colocynthis]|uniref:Secreted protein n=1 Tax=Citrullus colocynthis TaxID=252529 RepID=A0ABP0XW35_9ROSI